MSEIIFTGCETQIEKKFSLVIWISSEKGRKSHRIYIYRKTTKNSDTQKMNCNFPKIWPKWIFHRVMSPQDAEWQTGRPWSDCLIWVCTICPHLSVRNFRIIMVIHTRRLCQKVLMIFNYRNLLPTTAFPNTKFSDIPIHALSEGLKVTLLLININLTVSKLTRKTNKRSIGLNTCC